MLYLKVNASALAVVPLITAAAAAQEGDSVPPVSEQLQNPQSADVTITGSVVEPAQLEPTGAVQPADPARRVRDLGLRRGAGQSAHDRGGR